MPGTRTRPPNEITWMPALNLTGCTRTKIDSTWCLAEVDGNRTRRTGVARPSRFEGGGAHQVPGHLHRHDRSAVTVSAREEAPAPVGSGRHRHPGRSEGPLHLTVAG